MPEAGQLQVELTETGVPSAVWVVTPNGRFTIAAYAAPKTAGLWREVAGELADSLRKDSAKVSIKDGPWGREVVGTASGAVRFIGVDGYRWMIRCVINGPHETIEALEQEARDGVGGHRRSPWRHTAAGPDAVARAAARADGRTAAGGRGRAAGGRRRRRHRPLARDSRPPSRPHAAARTDRPCSSCAPRPAASLRELRPRRLRI